MREQWLSSVSFADLAGITRQVANRLLASFAEGKKSSWRGAELIVRQAQGRGGRGGLSYQVAADSLPTDLQELLNAPLTGAQLALPIPVKHPSNRSKERDWWHFTLHPALCHPKGSKEREAAIRAMTGTMVLDWKMRPRTLSRSTIYTKLQKLETTGSSSSLMRKERTDRGQTRVAISRVWDGAVSFDDETKKVIADRTLQEMRGAIAAGATRSRALQHVATFLQRQTHAHGFRVSADAAELERICQIPASLFYQEKAVYSKVYRHLNDRKASEDDMPITRRLRPAGPGEVYVLDVHHINVLVRGRNGKDGTVKMLGCLDWGTGRFTAEFIFFELRGGVRNIDNIELIRRVFADPAWGVPKLVYIDNGSEYNFADFLDTALKLAAGDDGYGENARASRIIRALPYNGRAKPIENVHHQLNNHEFRHYQGFIDDDRFDPMRPALGKLPEPFGNFEDFVERARATLHAYNWVPQKHGQLKGDSPNSRFRKHVEKGWAATVLNPDQFDSLFVTRKTRTVRNQAISVGGRLWTCRGLDGHLADQVIACVPLYHGFNELRLETLDGAFIDIATPDREFEFDDNRGAQSSNDRKKATRNAIRETAKSVPKVDMGESRQLFGDSQPPIHANPPAGEIRVSLEGQHAKAIVPSKSARSSQQERLAENERIAELRSKFAPGRRAVS